MSFSVGALFDRAFKDRPNLHAAYCVVGIVGSLMGYGVLQERIMTQPYGNEGELFKYSLFLVLSNRLLTCSVAAIVLLAKGLDMKPSCPTYSYAAVSVSNTVATTCQYEALKYVSFPVQTLGKCAKMIPVMVWGSIIMRKVYKAKDYGLAAAITLGSTLFLLTGEVRAKSASRSADSSLLGIGLMGGYLAFDGFTSTFQDRLFKGYNMTIYNQILYTTLFSSGFSLFGLVSSGQLMPAIDFITRYPEALTGIFTLSLAATTGQLFIVHTIRTFGALLFATVMTTRQFLSILVSCVLFAHPLSAGQWAGTAVVFGAIFYKTLSHKSAPKAELAEEKKPLTKDEENGAAPDEKVPLKAVA